MLLVRQHTFIYTAYQQRNVLIEAVYQQGRGVQKELKKNRNQINDYGQ